MMGSHRTGSGIMGYYSTNSNLLDSRLLNEVIEKNLKDIYYPTMTTVITTLVILGQLLKLLAHVRTNSAIKELLNLVPATAFVIPN